MQVMYSDKPFERHDDRFGIFLAGPSPRSPDVRSWRPEVLEQLRGHGFTGVVYVPEWETGFTNSADYIDQIQWEWDALDRCDEPNGLILFWIPRELPTMPAFTTNVEFGLYVKSSRILYGRPAIAAKIEYLDRLYRRFHPEGQIYDTLPTIVGAAAIHAVGWKAA